MVDVTDDEELRGESEIYDLWNQLEGKVVELADGLQLTDEELQKIEARWLKIGQEKGHAEGHAIYQLARHTLVIRRLRKMTSMMRPGEEMVPLTELAARMRGKGEA